MEKEKPDKKALLEFLTNFFSITGKEIDKKQLEKAIDKRWPEKEKDLKK